jgi:excisionase family DNA binding protein
METNVNAPDRNTSTSASSGYASASRFRREGIKFFTIPEVAECLNVSTRTVRRWIKRGELIAHRLGGVVRIAESDLRAFLLPATARSSHVRCRQQLSRYVNSL